MEKNKIISEWASIYLKDLLKFAHYKTSDMEVAENLVQDTFEAVVQGFDSFSNLSNAKTWIYGILNNKIKDYYKIKKTTSKNVEFVGEFVDSSNNEYFDEQGSWEINKKPKDWLLEENHNLLDDVDFGEVFRQCIENLPDLWRDCIKMRYVSDLKGKDICDVLSINQTNFWQVVHRAKLQLRNCLEINWFEK